MTVEKLLSLLVLKGTPTIKVNGIPYILSSVTREDGSGHKFILGLVRHGVETKIFVNCKKG